MSRRRHTDPRRESAAPTPPSIASTPRTPTTAGGQPPRAASRVARSAAPHPVFRALLPLRFFLGGMFLYAGMDKLVDPTFLRATGAASVGAQLDAYVRVSPLAPLITIFAQPWPVAIGLLIAIAEIAVGIGALTGIFYRWSAWLGATLAGLFFLTASWSIRPLYFGPDLPYMVGWVTLALAGSGGLYVLDERLSAWSRQAPLPAFLVDDDTPASTGRRAILQVGALGLAAVAVAAIARGFGRILAPVFTQQTAASLPAPTPSTAPAPSPSAVAGASAPAATAAATGIANTKDVPKRSAVDFQIPNGDPGILVKLADGTVVAYDAICTHQGCPVGYDRPSGLLFCPCHGATFDPAQGAAVTGGPAPYPLASVPITIDPTSGEIAISF